MATVKVTLDPTKTPPVSLVPNTLDIDCHGETVHWVPADQTSTFTFVALVFEDDNPFCNVVVKQNPREITARDINQSGRSYLYRIWVRLNTNFYSSDGGTTIAGGPTIRNN
jgi:hypothetical protein